jgi:hypothetical protein
LATAVIGSVYFGFALYRFRRVIFSGWAPPRKAVPNMRIAVLATIVVVVVGFAVAASADERPSDPFGNHTTEVNKEDLLPLVVGDVQRRDGSTSPSRRTFVPRGNSKTLPFPWWFQLEVLAPPRAPEELSGQISKLASITLYVLPQSDRANSQIGVNLISC